MRATRHKNAAAATLAFAAIAAAAVDTTRLELDDNADGQPTSRRREEFCAAANNKPPLA